ncbi:MULTISPECIES: TolC family outer membrane protein [Pseudocitrobacter]|uniref:Adhesin transport system outer membrane protein n=1 Tax=Pseudocitrobacter faecalis TaxID=1398493 RepID=A0ABX9FPZ9_9ENTR|nr:MULTISPECIES: TolC family outer membrane protein [Pseudocitrobacter]RAU40830.1 channel protein TolC [Pseudocitrobacter sp. RIT 415]RBP07271.1 adhesin transport system outer membrane protein [Pseudocitrobacter faecalis]GHD97223.1 channel protein TolC [Pseudocitrobacter faecalis]
MHKSIRVLTTLSLPLLFAQNVSAATLEQAVKDSLLWHPQVSASVNSRYSADQDLRAAKGGYLPTLDLTAGTGWEQTDNATTRAANDHRRDLHRSESSINLSQNLFNGFATTSEVARQQATVNSRAHAVMNTSEVTALNAIQTYLDVLMRQKMVQLAEENLKNHERVFDQIRLRTEQGVGRTADFEQAQARLAQAQNNLLTEQTNLQDAQANYYSVVGKEATDLSLPVMTQIPASQVEARKLMLENSPLLKQADSDVEATRQQYEAAKSRFYPSVDVDVGRRMDNNVDGTRGHDQEWQAMVRMRYNLFNGGSDKAQLSSYAYKMQEAQDVKRNALRQLDEELRLSWNAWENAKKQVPIAKDYAERSAIVRTAYQEQFSIGERSLLDMLDSENEVFTAQRRYVEMQFVEMFTTYRINARIGDLLKQLKIQAPSAAQPEEEQQTAHVNLPELK